MKVYILYELKEGPYGGANQFLKAIKQYFGEKGIYADSMEEADAFLFNSCNDVLAVMQTRQRFPDKLFVQRMDGPSRLYNKKTDMRDFIANTLHSVIADATVFQSDYSRKANYTLGLKPNEYETVIWNAPDSLKFYPPSAREPLTGRKVRLIASSWSDNINKGFKTYEYLDRYLDFDRYEMCFVGNSPIKFQNIRMVRPQDSEKLGELLRQQDIFIMASKKESCSNALIEALFCGLPAVALRDGGNPELLSGAGELYDSAEEIPDLLDKISRNYKKYTSAINLPDLKSVGDRYAGFINKTHKDMESKNKKPKKLKLFGRIRIHFSLLIRKVSDRLFVN